MKVAHSATRAPHSSLIISCGSLSVPVSMP